MTYQNGQVEAVLAKVCRIPADELGSFKGKLRHLRSLGIPKVEKVGSGNRAQFSRLDALTMRLALELSMLGVKPTAVAGLTEKGLELLEEHTKTAGAEDVYLVVFAAHPKGYIWETVYGASGIAKVAPRISRSTATSFVCINLSKMVQDMDAGLKM
jgi:hypothetical protein